MTDLYTRALNLYRKGKTAEAEELCRRILRGAPRHVAAQALLGRAQVHRGNADEGIASFDAALALRPEWPELLLERGNALQRLGRHADALDSYDRAITFEPDYVMAHANRAIALRQLGRLEDALASYERALSVAPADAVTLYNRGNLLLRLNRHLDAVESYDRALAARPDYIEALNNRGLALAHLWRFQDAVATYDRLLALVPELPDALFNRGNALRRLGRLEDALVDYRKAYALQPDHPQVLGAMVRCELLLCDWDGVDRHGPELHRRVHEGSARIAPFSWLSLFDDPAGHLVCARQAIQEQAGVARPAPLRRPRSGNRIRLAYLSPNFRDQNMSTQIAELFALHDRSRFDVTAVSFGPNDGSAMRARLERSFDEFHDVRTQSDQAVAALMQERGIDIAIDLNGHLDNARWGIFSHRAAPIQVNYLGYPGTSGAEFIDYVIADEVVAPFAQAGGYSEKIVQLPGSYLVNDREKRIAPATPTRAECGLPKDGFVFCCFNLAPKIRAPVFDVWMRLLGAFEGSVLWLAQASETIVANLRREAAARGVDPSRLVFARRLARLEDHLARHRVADLFLDTLPFNAHTTACDALWAGLPMLTCPGEGFAARVGASALHATGLPELVAPTLHAYEAQARRLASDPALLGSVRQRLQTSRSRAPLFDTDAFCRHMESAYQTMWDIWRRGEAPRNFAVGGSAE